MKTLRKGLSRGLSVLLVLMMLVSLVTVGIVSTSAADVTLAETKYSSSDTLYAVSSITSWDADSISKMDWISSSSKFQKIVKGVTPSGILYFRFRDNYEQAIHPNSSESVRISPTLGSGYDITDLKYDKNHYDPSWQIDLSQYAASASKIDIYFEFDISGGNNKVHLYICESASSSGSEAVDLGDVYASNNFIGWGVNDSSKMTFDSATSTYTKTFTGVPTTAISNGNTFAFKIVTSKDGVDKDIHPTASGYTDVTPSAFDTKLLVADEKNSPDDVNYMEDTSDASNNWQVVMTNFADKETVNVTVELNSVDQTVYVTVSEATATPSNNAVVYINPGDVADLYAWIWDSNNTQYSGSSDWPGKAVTSGTADSNGYYKFEVSGYTDWYKIIISINGNTKIYDGDTADGLTAPEYYINITGSSSGNYTVSTSPVVAPSMWVDVVADKDYADTNIDRIYPAKNGNEYTFYLPSGVDINNLIIGHTCESLTIGSNAITDGSAYSFALGTSYNVSGDLSGTVKFYQSANVATLYTYTEESMPTTTKGSDYTKDSYSTKGTIMKIGADGVIDVDEAVLKKIKGRGNSSWEASATLLGKYSYNLTLDSKAVLIEGAKKNKKYSLLANNMDESRMRNMVIYNLATEVGVKYTSKFEAFDVYNNGLYMGSYLLAEKVEIGDPLVDIVDLESINEDANLDIYANDSQVKTTASDTMYASNLAEPDSSLYQESGFLLEFEYSKRYSDEFSGFISTKGQNIVCKYPEFATKNEIEFIRDKWNAAEAVMYNTSATYEELDAVIDVESFAKMYLIQELSKNLDAGCTSYYVYYDGGKLHAGVAWDYDWTLGQYGTDASGNSKSGFYPTVSTRFTEVNSELHWTSHWHVNSKPIDCNSSMPLNAQAQLCQNENFWAVVAAEWNENFYDTALSYTEGSEIGSVSGFTTSKIADYYNTVNASVNMDEQLWHLLANDTIRNNNWGSIDTGDTHNDAAVYLHNWYLARLQWMDHGSDAQGNSQALGTTAYTIQPPVLTSDKDVYASGELVTLTIDDKTDGDYTYTIYNGAEAVATITDRTYTFTADNSGTYSYTVKATSNNSGKSATSEAAEITVEGFIFTVDVDAPTAVMVGENIVITATANADDVNYVLKQGDTVVGENTTGQFIIPAAAEMSGNTYTYSLTATTTVDAQPYYYSEDITVTVNPFTFSVKLSAPASVEAGMVITLDANAVSNSEVTYSFYQVIDDTPVLLGTNTTGIYSIDAETEDIGKTLSYYVVASTTVAGTPYTETSSTVTVDVTAVSEVYDVTVYFKSANSYAYIPKLTTNGALDELKDYAMTREVKIGTNATYTSSY
ncbi:MAG: CotH kinase family protein, partial [Ruminococcus sp.]